jgi:hypothetical protein
LGFPLAFRPVKAVNLGILVAALSTVSSIRGADTALALTETNTLSFATVEKARELLRSRDEFIQRLSPFDRCARLKTDRAVSEDQFLDFVAKSARPWESGEQKKLEAVASFLRTRLAGLKLTFPKTVWLVKTDGTEEGGAAYTREDAVILPANLVSAPEAGLRGILAHELFHVASRHDPKRRDALYAAIGFTRCDEIKLPEPLRARQITNPDAPSIEHFIRVTRAGKEWTVVPVLISRAARYDPGAGGEFFAYMQFRFLAIQKGRDRWEPILENDQPMLLSPGQASNFSHQVGRDGMPPQPEEIVAAHVEALVGGSGQPRSPEITARIRQVLSN